MPTQFVNLPNDVLRLICLACLDFGLRTALDTALLDKRMAQSTADVWRHVSLSSKVDLWKSFLAALRSRALKKNAKIFMRPWATIRSFSTDWPSIEMKKKETKRATKF